MPPGPFTAERPRWLVTKAGVCVRASEAVKRSVANGRNWPGPDIGNRQLSARPPRTAGFRRDDRNREDRQPTHRSRRRFSRRATGLPWNLTFADAVEKVMDDDSGRSQVATTDPDQIAAERLHPKAAY